MELIYFSRACLARNGMTRLFLFEFNLILSENIEIAIIYNHETNFEEPKTTTSLLHKFRSRIELLVDPHQ